MCYVKVFIWFVLIFIMDDKIIVDKLEVIQRVLAGISDKLDDLTITSDDLRSIDDAKNDLREKRTRRL